MLCISWPKGRAEESGVVFRFRATPENEKPPLKSLLRPLGRKNSTSLHKLRNYQSHPNPETHPTALAS